MPARSRQRVLAFGSFLLASSTALAQCPPAATYFGFHQESVGSALASYGDEAIFGHVFDPNCGMFERRGNDFWTRTALMGTGVSGGNAMGRSCDLGDDVAILGDPLDGSLPGHGSSAPNGAAVIFERAAGQWARAINLYPPTPVTVDGFGGSVAVDSGGVRAAVAAQTANGGEVHMFVRQPSGWVAEQVVPVPALPKSLAFANGLLFVGTSGGAAGEVHTFTQQSGTWTASTILAPSGLTAGAGFGACLSTDGSQVAVGAPGHSHTSTVATGAVYIFDTAQTNWPNQPRLAKPWPTASFSSFGRAIDIVGDRLAVGARDLALEFRRNATNGAWQPFFVTPPPHYGFSFEFGQAVAIFSSGLLVGDSYHDDDPYQYPDSTGGVHAYDLTDYGNVFQGCGRGIALQWGGRKSFVINWPQHANKAYQVFGSFTGLGPTPIGGITLPLSIDGYTTLLLGNTGTLMTSGIGVLNGNGFRLVEWQVPNGLPLWLAGLQFHHAVVVFDPGAVDASNAITTELVVY